MDSLLDGETKVAKGCFPAGCIKKSTCVYLL